MRPSGRISFSAHAMHSLKATVQQHVESNNFNVIVEMANKHPRVLSYLVRLSYDKDTLPDRRDRLSSRQVSGCVR
jgi:hypothetical protein